MQPCGVSCVCRYGVLHRGAVPVFTMVGCETARSLPLPQWAPTASTDAGMDAGGAGFVATRDVDLAAWDEALAKRRQARLLHEAAWVCKEHRAVWRGDIRTDRGGLSTYEQAWSARRRIEWRPVTNHSWRKQGRFALLHQKCAHAATGWRDAPAPTLRWLWALTAWADVDLCASCRRTHAGALIRTF